MLQVLLSGLASGAVYGLVGMGFAVAFYVTRVINFAEGQLLMVAVMVAAAIARTGVWVGFALAGGVVAAVLAGVATYFVAVRPVLAFSRFSFAWLVSTLGVALILQNVAAIIWGPTSRSFPTLLNGTGVHIGNATLTLQELVTIGVAIGMAVGFELVRKRTLFGKAGMAVAYDPEMASALGANTGMIAVIAFAGAGLFAGIAGHPDRADHLLEPVSRQHLRDRGLRRADDRRHGAAGGRDGRRAHPRDPRGGVEEPDQHAGV